MIATERTRRRWSAVLGGGSAVVAIGLAIGAGLGSAAFAAPLLVIAVLAPVAWSVFPARTITRVHPPRSALVLTARGLPPPLPRQGRLGSAGDAHDDTPARWIASLDTAPRARIAIP